MGEKQNQPFQLSFNASLRIDFQGSRVTSDGGLILVRELDERLGFGELITQRLSDARRGELVNFAGIDSNYDPPDAPEIRLNTVSQSAEECVDRILQILDQTSRRKAVDN